jgi:plastocyanin
MSSDFRAAAAAFLVCASGAALAGDLVGQVPLEEPAAAEDVLVYVAEVKGSFPPPAEPAALSQKGAHFEPAVLPVVVGTTVDLTNDDRTTHSVFSKSDTHPFDLGLYARGEPKLIRFEKTGVVDVFCSIHPKMSAVILVLQNGYWSRVDPQGRFKIAGVPAGAAEVVIFRRGETEQRIPVKVPAKGALKVAVKGAAKS